MRYGEGDRESEYVEDRRSEGGGGMFRRGGGMPFPIPMGGGGLSIGSLVLIGIVCLLLGINPLTLLSGGGLELPNLPRPERQGGPQDVPGLPGQRGVEDSNDEKARFVRRVLADTEDVWDQIFKGAGRQYRKPTLVLFRGATRTACGTGQSAMGPFYCPLDQKVYIDLSFYDDLKRRFHAPGDFAQAYVIAHEIGHHVQNLTGISDEVRQRQQAANSQAEANQWSVQLELQADCLAGVWAHSVYARGDLEPGDIEEGLAAAEAVGDDRIQEQAGMTVDPETWTHGSSAERQQWFDRGFESGESSQCDTFG